jgi:hypothetical protein
VCGLEKQRSRLLVWAESLQRFAPGGVGRVPRSDQIRNPLVEMELDFIIELRFDRSTPSKVEPKGPLDSTRKRPPISHPADAGSVRIALTVFA